MSKVLDYFLDYVKYDTQSKANEDQVPSTKKQYALARHLAEQLKEMGAENVRLSEEHCYVYATIPATAKQEVPSLGFIAHMDTSPAVSGKDVKARVIHYEGGDILLNEERQIVMKAAENPSLKLVKGQDLVVTDGTTLLGADDKAGVAEIMAAAEYLLAHPEIPHGAVQIGFTPDEEVGRGVDFFDVEGFGADYAYTVDSGPLGDLEFENFNAVNYRVTVTGKSIHPGSAKGVMKNALLMAMEFHQMLPVFENPAFTEGYEGFYHLDEMNGSVEKAVMEYIIRDHDAEKFDKKVERFQKIAEYLNEKYGEGSFLLTEECSYRNMREMIEPHMHLIDNAKKAMEKLGIPPLVSPIRGGTDGARLSYMGLPCPNLCTGGCNAHGRFEYACVQSMEKIVELIIEIIRLYA